jgi:signal transduction histidine kinase/CheY-like chemotaxis protein
MRALRPYLAGLGLVAVFSIVKLAFPPLGRDVPFVLYFAPPLVAALAGGRRPGLLTAVASAAAGNILFLPPRFALSTSWQSLLETGAFLVEGVIVVLVCDALVQERRRLELLQQATVALSRAMTVPDLARTLVDIGTSQIGAPRGAVWIVSDDRKTIELVRQNGYPERLARAVERVPIDSELPVVTVLHSKEICWVGSRDEYSLRYARANEETFPLRSSDETSFFCAPLLVEGAAVGTFSLNFDGRHVFGDAERRFIEAIVEQASLALHRARLFTSERETRSRSERLYQLTTALASTMTTGSVAERISAMAWATVGADTAALFVLDPAEDALVLKSDADERPDLRAYGRIPLDRPLPIVAVARDRTPRYFESREALALAAPAFANDVAESRFQSWALLPLVSAAGMTLGVLSFVFRNASVVADEDLHLMNAVAEQCAVALDRARAYEAEAVALRKKDEFLAMLGHELRNPLAPILTATKLIRMRGAASDRELGVLERQGRHLVRLVDDLLDVSRITSGKLTLKLVPVDVAEVIAQAVEITSKSFEDKRLRLTVSVSPGLGAQGDPDRLVQVLTNLLVNAAKFTEPERAVAITAKNQDGRVTIEVQDEGEGIDADLLPHVFELFTQKTQSSDRSGGGLGLGLAIARSIVLAHEGTITAESAGRGRGTKVTVTLPVSEALQAAPLSRPLDDGLAARPRRERRRILIVDDNADGAEMLAEFLGHLGYDTLVANDGPEALRVMADRPFHAAVLDIGLPGMDGYELAAEFRARYGDKVPLLVALTGYAQATDRERALAKGFDAHFGKPVDVARLAATFDQLIAPT